jgi:hypothetical protein
MSSRVEEDRQAAREVERRAEARRNEELQRQKRGATDSAFGQLVAKSQGDRRQAQEKAQAHARTRAENPHAQENIGQSAIASLLESAEELKEQEHTEQQHSHTAFRSRLGAKTVGEGLKRADKEQGEAGATVRQSDAEGTQREATVAQSHTQQGHASAALRKNDAKAAREALSERQEANEGGKSGASSRSPDAQELKVRADPDQGSQGQSGGRDGQNGAGAGQAAFRLNPALMAPVPVAQQKQTSGSERLRKVANELAQKIVERVRVGTNAAGRVEFQIDLRNDVLKGLSVKVSSHNGRIKAVFVGSDRDVLKLIEDQRVALTQALSARGLSIEELKIEARP